MGTCPAYIAGVLSSHYIDRLKVSQLCIARTDYPIIDNIYRKLKEDISGLALQRKRTMRVFPIIQCMELGMTS